MSDRSTLEKINDFKTFLRDPNHAWFPGDTKWSMVHKCDIQVSKTILEEEFGHTEMMKNISEAEDILKELGISNPVKSAQEDLEDRLTKAGISTEEPFYLSILGNSKN